MGAGDKLGAAPFAGNGVLYGMSDATVRASWTAT